MSMLALRTLGTLDLRRPNGAAILSVLAQPKRLALLVYLALARPRGFQRRDTLLALFWPELDEARARNALSQALHRLRGALGEEPIIARGNEEIGLDLQRLTCDAIAFEEAVKSGELAKALELYGGDLLNGFHVGDAPGFERWLDGERAHLRRRATEAAGTLAERAEAEGRVAEAVRWLRRALAIAPDEEEALRRLIRILDGAGEPAAAVREYEEFARRLSEDYDLEPAPETRELIHEIRRGERALELSESHDEPKSERLQEQEPGGQASRERRPAWRASRTSVMREIHRRSLWQVLAVYLAGAAGGFAIIRALTEGLGLPVWFPWLAIVLFIIGLPVVLATAFVQHGPPRVSRANPHPLSGSTEVAIPASAGIHAAILRLLTWRRSIITGAFAFALWGAIAAGWLLDRGGVDLLVAKSLGFVREGDRVLVAEIENLTDHEHLGAAVREAIVTDLAQSPYVDVLEFSQLGPVLERMRLPDTSVVTAELALEVARREGYSVVIAGSVSRIGPGYQVSARILETATGRSMARVRQTATEAEIIDAVERVSRLLRRHLGESLASVRRSPPLPRVTTASLEALEFLARARDHERRGEWSQAITAAERAVELDTAFAGAYAALAVYHNNLHSLSRSVDHYLNLAFHHAGRLPTLERLSVIAQYHLRHGRVDSAAHYLELLIEADPNRPEALNALGNAYTEMGREEEALPFYRRALELEPSRLAPHANFIRYARRLGREPEADTVLLMMEQRFPDALGTYIGRVARELHLRDLEMADSLAIQMRSHADPAIRFWGATFELYLAAMRGQLVRAIQGADSLFPEAVRLAGPAGASACLRMAVTAAVAAGEPARALSMVRRAESHLLGRSSVWLAVPPEPEMLAIGYALAGEIDAARRVLAQTDSMIEAGDLPEGPNHEIRAVIALAEQRPHDAVAQLGQARRRTMGPFVWAEANAAVGRHEEAAAAYESVLRRTPHYGYPTFEFGAMWPLAHERLGGIYLAQGDTAAALRHLSAFAELWKDADTELQPRVEVVRAVILRLSRDRPGLPREAR